jgi:hypothetical protein
MTKNSINNTVSDLQVSAINLSGSTISTTTSNTDLTLSPSGTGDVVVTASSVVPSTDRINNLGNTTNSWNNIYANSLSFDDGTNTINRFIQKTAYTPVIVATNSNTIIYTINEGFYSVIANQVFYSAHIIISSKGTATSGFNITLPPFPFFTSISTSCFTPYLSLVNFTGSNGIGRYALVVFDTEGNKNLQTITSSALVNNLTMSNLSDGSVLRFSGYYTVA